MSCKVKKLGQEESFYDLSFSEDTHRLIEILWHVIHCLLHTLAIELDSIITTLIDPEHFNFVSLPIVIGLSTFQNATFSSVYLELGSFTKLI